MQMKFAATSVLKTHSKMCELSMYPDYDHFILLISK